MQKRLAVVAAALLLASHSALAVPETHLHDLYSQQILPFWQSQVKEGHLKSRDGLQLAYAYVVPANAKATIVLVQGRTEAYIKYAEVFFDLTQQGYAVFMLDHRGQGLSARMLEDPHKGHVELFQQYADDQQQFVANVVQPNSRGPLLLLAHSMGGAVASQMLAQQPLLFKAAVLSSPMMAPNAEILFGERDGCGLETIIGWACSDCYAGFASQPYVDQPFEENILMSSTARYQQFRKMFREYPQAQLGGPTWQWLNQACAVSEQMPKLAQQIQVPVLILQAGADQAVSNDAQVQFCKELSAHCANGQVQRIEGAKHELLFERDELRNQAMSKISAFFAAQLGAASN